MELKHSNGININHLSPSTISSFIENKYGFYMNKVVGKRFTGNQYTARGKAIEHGINVWLEKPETENLMKLVYGVFDDEISQSSVSKIEASETRDSLQGLFNVAYSFYRNEFSETGALTQQKVEHQIEGVDRIVLGYLDFLVPGICVRDCKVVSKTPSCLSQAYIVQGSFYKLATGLDVVFDFFVDNKKPVNKSIVLSEDNYIFGMSYLTKAAQVIEQLQEETDTREIMRLMSFPDLSAMYNVSDKKDAAKVWGIAY